MYLKSTEDCFNKHKRPVLGGQTERSSGCHAAELACRKRGDGTPGSKYQKQDTTLCSIVSGLPCKQNSCASAFFCNNAYVHCSGERLMLQHILKRASGHKEGSRASGTHQTGYRPPRPLSQTTLSHDTVSVCCVQQTSSHHCVTLGKLLSLFVPRVLRL